MWMRTCFLALLMAFMVGCSGKSLLTSNNNVSGAYDIIVTSNVTGAVTLVEANLSANGNQSTATGPTQVQILTLEKKIWYVNGSCPGKTPGQNGVTTKPTGENLAVTFDEGGHAFGGQAVFTGNTINGSYAISGSNCPDLVGVIGIYPPGYDQGGFVGNPGATLTGTFAGPLTLPSGTDNATFSLSEGKDQALTITAKLMGADNGTFKLTGKAIGNSIFVNGTIDTQNVTLLGYYDRQGTFSTYPGSLLLFNYVTQSEVGVLLQQ
jgi:hypothetical protein